MGRTWMAGAVAAVTLAAGGASAATTFQASLTIDELVGYLNGEDPQESFSVVEDVSFSLLGILPSVVITDDYADPDGDGRRWTYSMPGSLDLVFQGSLFSFDGQVSGDLDVFYDFDFGLDGGEWAEVQYATSFSGSAADGTSVNFGVAALMRGGARVEDGGVYTPAEAASLISQLDSGEVDFGAVLNGDPTILLFLNGPGGTFGSELTGFRTSGLPYRLTTSPDLAPSPVPLPASITLLGAALAGLGLVRRQGSVARRTKR